ncbi:rhodanese-like domain-containing protein [Haloferacaceae archaeon DSL9]
MERQQTRRRLLQTTGALTLAAVAGCSGQADEADDEGESNDADAETDAPAEGKQEFDGNGPRHGDDLPADENPDDGYPPEFDSEPEERDVDVDSFETVERGGREVALVPADVAYYWYVRREARFIDTRSEAEFDMSRIFGAVWSQAPDGRDDDPVDDWPTEDRIVTYCRCPNHLASLRAAALLDEGYEEVYAIEEGYDEWIDNAYPLDGTDADAEVDSWVITGETDAADAGETAWAIHEDTRQQEAARIGDDGGYELDVRFVDVDDDAEIAIETPSYEFSAPLGELADGHVTADGSVESD